MHNTAKRHLPATSSNVELGLLDRIYRSLLSFVDKRPLMFVLALAVVLRLIAVIFSKGYMASDDHFETVKIALQWLQNGSPLNADGLLTWHTTAIGGITRFPLYNLSIYGIFVFERWLGMTSLGQMMYGVRFFHAALSLVGVLAVYRTVELVTKSTRWAVLGGVLIAGHFILPFLSVRALIEMVGGNLWILAIYFLYRWRELSLNDTSSGFREIRNNYSANRLLLIAGLITGLAWMVRFQISLAALPIPLILYLQTRSIKPAVWYSLGVSVMLLLAGIIDYALIGSFMASTVNHLDQIRREEVEGVMYNTSVFIYLTVITLFLTPPLALLVYWQGFKKEFWQKHALLVFSALSFILLHMVTPNRQERYMIPIIPALLLIASLVIWHRHTTVGYILKNRALLRALIILTVTVNVGLLALFTLHYGHKGIVEPFTQLAKYQDTAISSDCLIISPSFTTFFPEEYAEYVITAEQINSANFTEGRSALKTRFLFSWPEIASSRADSLWLDSVDYVLLYPGNEAGLSNLLDSLNISTDHARRMFQQEMFHVEPSQFGRLLNWLNPRHNPTYEVWVYSRR